MSAPTDIDYSKYRTENLKNVLRNEVRYLESKHYISKAYSAQIKTFIAELEQELRKRKVRP